MLKIINQTLLICKYYLCKTRNFAGLNFISLKNNILNTKQLQEKIAGNHSRKLYLQGICNALILFLILLFFFIYFIVSLIYFHCKIACTC